jgi:hypothetical protein
MVANQETTLEYHCGRVTNELTKGIIQRTLFWHLLNSVRQFKLERLKHAELNTRRSVFHYAVLPIDQRIEDLQAKVHRYSMAINKQAALIDIKRDIKILYQEFKVYEQEKNKELDNAYMLGFNEGSRVLTDGNFFICTSGSKLHDNK